jgi:hypothetical protein
MAGRNNQSAPPLRVSRKPSCTNCAHRCAPDIALACGRWLDPAGGGMVVVVVAAADGPPLYPIWRSGGGGGRCHAAGCPLISTLHRRGSGGKGWWQEYSWEIYVQTRREAHCTDSGSQQHTQGTNQNSVPYGKEVKQSKSY